MVAEALIALSVGLPLTLAAALLLPALRHGVWLARIAPWSALPMLLSALVPGELDLGWLMLGMSLGVDPVSMPLLLLAGIVWTAAGWHARAQFAGDASAWRYWLFHLFTLGANAGLLLAQDLLGLYLWYAIMTLSVYGLVVHDREDASLRAGRVYMIIAIAAEGLLIAALLILGAQIGNAPLASIPAVVAEHPQGLWLASGLFVGFAVKMGTMPLHIWLPLAHPRAPVPASAVLSGVIVKAGMVGWLRLLPHGADGFAVLGYCVIGLGVLSALAAGVLGLTQRNPKVVLAYSTISQMGLIAMLLGAAFLAPALWPAVLPAMLLFALHHGLAKGALFLGVGVQAPWRRWLLLIPAAAIAGVPLTSGALAKAVAKQAAAPMTGFWGETLPHWFAASSVVTSLLLLHFLALIWNAERSASRARQSATLPFTLLVVTGLFTAWLWAQSSPDLPEAAAFGNVWEASWPVLGALIAVLAVRRFAPRVRPPNVPEGDLVVLVERAAALTAGRGPRFTCRPLSLRTAIGRMPIRALVALDRHRLRFAAAGGMLLTGGLLLAWAVLR